MRSKFEVLNQLRRVCNLPDLRFELPVSVDYQLVLALYNNYSIEELALEPEEEEDVIRILKEGLPVCSTQKPQWFFDQLDSRNGA